LEESASIFRQKTGIVVPNCMAIPEDGSGYEEYYLLNVMPNSLKDRYDRFGVLLSFIFSVGRV
jgi:hypothetical protein